MNSTLTLKSGDKIITTYGNIYTVTEFNGQTVNDTTVYVTDTLQQTVHITKIVKVISK